MRWCEWFFPEMSIPRLARRIPSHDLVITDTTLRDGQQGSRSFTEEECIKIYTVLSELDNSSGILRDIELFPYTSKDRRVIKALRGFGTTPKPIGWVRASIEDIKLVKESGLDTTVLLTSVSDYHIYHKLGMDRERAREKFLYVIREAMRIGLRVKVAMEDITRADIYGFVLPFMEEVIRISEEERSEVGFKLSDTLGLALPFSELPLPRSVPKLVRTLVDELGLKSEQLEFHGHNDFHLVVANHLAAWLYGASISNCTMMGIGERAGNCPLEAMVLLRSQITGDNRMNLRVLGRIADLFREMGFSVPKFYPLLGDNAFNTKAGIHIDGLLKNPCIYLPFDPEIIGRSYSVEVSPYSGRSGLIYWLAKKLNLRDWRILKDDPRIDIAYNDMMKLFENERTDPLSEEEIMSLVRRYFPELSAVSEPWQ
ncbi:MAG: 2-isopropylmalate synthase [Candidatus Korarchaeum sp.]|nr:2-isopropylmalate synthase [Candidatus Korarchaeum sp.]MDW8035689.1 2-isopropylmalate synthase [Candidatus Korarchaeum sp.]